MRVRQGQRVTRGEPRISIGSDWLSDRARDSLPSGIEHVPRSEPPRVVLKSLNPGYDSYERPAGEVRVVGRAVWVSRRL